MRHASPAALDRLDNVLVALRAIPALKEKSRGAFYRGGRSFLHFHEHGEALFADMRGGGDFDRLEVTTSAAQRVLLAEVRRRLSDTA